MSAPVVVNTTDGTVWTRREATRDGLALYAPEKCAGCPEFVMATYAELEGHGVAGSADVLPMPMPVRPEPLSAERLAEIRDRAVYLRAHGVDSDEHELELSAGTDVPALLDEVARLRRVLREACDQVASLESDLGGATTRVTELEAERHSTNEALDDAVQQRRADQEAFEAVRALCDAADYAGITSGGWFTVEAIRKALGLAVPGPDAVTAVFAERAARESDPGRRTAWRMLAQDVADGEHYALVHHDYRVGHDLPETGGAR